MCPETGEDSRVPALRYHQLSHVIAMTISQSGAENVLLELGRLCPNVTGIDGIVRGDMKGGYESQFGLGHSSPQNRGGVGDYSALTQSGVVYEVGPKARGFRLIPYMMRSTSESQ